MTRSIRVFVLGATGGTGRAVVQQAIARGFDVTAFVRAPEKLADVRDSIQIWSGDPCDTRRLTDALHGHDAVISALGHRGLGRSSLLIDSARALLPAMRSAGVDRILAVSVGLLFEDAGFFAHFLRRTFLHNVVQDSAAMEGFLIPSGLDWTIARPPILTNGPETSNYDVADGRLPVKTRAILCRADLADFLLKEVERPAHEHRIVGLGTMKAFGVEPVRTVKA